LWQVSVCQHLKQFICTIYLAVQLCTNTMSRLTKTPPSSMLEPETFEEEKVEQEYIPQHPMLALHSQLAAASNIENEDHIDNYVEVNPFEAKEKN